MKRIIPSVCIAMACAVSLGAQSSPQQYPQDQPQSKMSSSDKDKTVSLTGCLQEGDTPNTFVLANVDASALRGTRGTSGETPSTPPPTGTTGTATSSDKEKVELSGGASANLKDHVGQQVQVTGTLTGKAGSAGMTGTTGATDPGSETERSAGSMGDKDMHKLTVKSVKMVSSTCSM